jgi:2-hydroxychromene-2-carboxylate isomerase
LGLNKGFIGTGDLARLHARLGLSSPPSLAKPRNLPMLDATHAGETAMAEIDYYLFPLSPFAYLAGLGLEEIAARRGATITYKPVQLLRIFAETGTPALKDRHVSRQKYRLQDIARLGRAGGLPVNPAPRHFPTNPVPASAAIISAQAAGGGDLGALVHGVLRAVWAEERDIAEDAVVRDLLAQAGFDPALADRGLLTAVETLERNTDEAIRRMVFGAPTYVVGDEVFWGQDRLPLLEAHLAALD